MISSSRQASERWRAFTVGQRVIVRRRRDDDPAPGEPSLTDVIGLVVARDDSGITLDARQGTVHIPAGDVVAARVLSDV